MHYLSADSIVFGRCSFSREAVERRLNAIPVVHFLVAQLNRRHLLFVHYERPRREAMQFYSLDYNAMDILPSRISGDTAQLDSLQNPAFLTCDFTRPALQTGPQLNQAVIDQLNVAQLLADAVDRASKGRIIVSHVSAFSEPVQPLIASNRNPAAYTNQMLAILRNLSTTVEQFDIRFEQGAFMLAQAPVIYRGHNWRTTDSISRYVKFYNCLWLVLNDIIIGVALGSFLCENDLALAQWLQHYTQYYLVECAQRALIWLNSWPAGLKLNTELSQFYCQTLLGIIFVWGKVLQEAAPYFPWLFWMTGVMGSCGMTMIVSLLSDTLSLLTLHLNVCYLLSATAFRHELQLAGSLWNLFRGKRFNVLRNRLDSWDYDLDQLLLGTILFTLVAFLYPTVLTYYALFATVHFVIIMLHASLDTITALLNHFPLFALMLRVKDPMRLPGRIAFRPLTTQQGSLVLESQPAPLSLIFMHYAHLWSRLSSHYHPLRILRLLTSGQRLTLIPRSSIRFSMIPTKGGGDARGNG
ncbi:Gpi1-domain-containing protein [Laetiporus sulphureus 93-53]|uniref:Gpi1-domain-containing protein n=1 Tax=Laetiporus sulphureus 93-53 TaxID=1314785 RepID=A0A165DHB0_9APHY|nr:Gpi1-domain-containing protein [Laetiporus sulphureus 93-53]KZT04877.1 Gpi1-domain-containing protein [Laetiporus sulphureus 93-53]